MSLSSMEPALPWTIIAENPASKSPGSILRFCCIAAAEVATSAIAAPDACAMFANWPTAFSAPAMSPVSLTYSSAPASRSEEHTSELQSQSNLVCRLLLEKKKKKKQTNKTKKTCRYDKQQHET